MIHIVRPKIAPSQSRPPSMMPPTQLVSCPLHSPRPPRSRTLFSSCLFFLKRGSDASDAFTKGIPRDRTAELEGSAADDLTHPPSPLPALLLLLPPPPPLPPLPTLPMPSPPLPLMSQLAVAGGEERGRGRSHGRPWWRAGALAPGGTGSAATTLSRSKCTA